MLHNQLIEILEEVILEYPEGMNEYELITKLQNPPYELFDKKALNNELNLFQCHFILFHCLYRLQNQWVAQQRFYLDIHVTCIRLRTWNNKPIEGDCAKLRAYYLDWQNFDKTREEDVLTLLNSFWEKVGKLPISDEKEYQQALTLFGLASGCTDTELKKRYRALLHQHHPDKGGDVDMAQSIEWAYGILKSRH